MIAALAALVVALGVAAPAWAADATVNIENAGDSSYTFYKIFDVENNSGGNGVTYTISSDSAWFSVIYDSDAKASKITGLTITEGTGGVYTVTSDSTFDARAFAAKLKENVSEKTAAQSGVKAANGSTTATATGLSAGYYLIVGDGEHDSRGMLATLLSLEPGETKNITNKNDMPFEKKIVKSDNSKVDKAPAQVGDTVNFQITGTVPNTSDYTVYTYLVSDKMDSGLAFDKASMKITINGTTINPSEVTDASAALTGDQIRYNSDGFELSLDMLNRGKGEGTSNLAGKSILITYSAKVTSEAVATVSENNIELKYSNDPNDSTKTEKKTDKTETYTAKVVINKYDSNYSKDSTDAGAKLAGAKFKLYKEVNGSKQYYKKAEDGTVSFVSDSSDATEVTTDTAGAASFDGLPDGDYKLEETEAPDGYTKVASDAPVTVNGTAATKNATASLTVTSDVSNTRGTELPGTGGMGTTIFYIASAAVLAAIVIRVVRHRREA